MPLSYCGEKQLERKAAGKSMHVSCNSILYESCNKEQL
jgi:hypothetical protein